MKIRIMVKKLFYVSYLLLTPFFIKAQTESATSFESFASAQSSLFVKAYEQKDIPAYQKLLDAFTDRYNKLDSATKKELSAHLQNAYYNLSCTYALLNNKSQAISYLRKSIIAGYLNYAHMQEDRDLDNIRGEQEFKTLLAGLRATGDYLFILKQAGMYNNKDDRDIPAFTYQSAEDSNLRALRKGFNLDSIAGEGSDILKMINLMHWVHNLIPHDGNHANPQVKNAMNMISVCKKENRGLNCRGLATVLNECYLAMGFNSRFITCLPKDSLKVDPDCHVINMIYSTSLQKWIWMDPTNNAYVMNEEGNLLSIEEVRDRIISGKPLLLNPNANWNNKVSKTKEDYLYNYMAKNLYLLQCPVNSEYNTETEVDGKKVSYITLTAVAYFHQQYNAMEEKNKKSTTTYKMYQTNNSEIFWKKPSSK